MNFRWRIKPLWLTIDWLCTLEYYCYYEPSLAGHRSWGLQYQNLKRIFPRVILVWQFFCDLLEPCVFSVASNYSVHLPNKGWTYTDTLHTFALTHTHKKNVSNAPVLHVFELWGKTGAPGRRKPASAPQGEHASKQTPHKKASSWFSLSLSVIVQIYFSCYDG